MASTIVILCFAAAICYIVRWLFLFFRGGQEKIEGIRNKYVLITGSGSGFGKQIAVQLDQLGVRVIATCRTKAGEESVRAACSNRVKTYCMDVTDVNQVREVFESVKKEIPADEGLWGLVNNAGKLSVGMIELQPLDSFKRIADVNLWGTIFVTQTFLPLVKKARGRIVNIGSILGRIVLPYLSAYTISKYGLSAFSDALRREMLPWGVHVSIIEAGAHKTKLVSGDVLAEQWQSLWNELSEEMKREYGGKEGLRRAGLWGLVNNAGILYFSPIEWTPLDTFRRTADVNLWGMIDVTKTFLPLIKKTRGRVVNLSSLAGRVSFNFYASYSVTKYGVEAFSDALRREMQPWGIKVSMLEPGSFLTNICAPDVFEQQLRQAWNTLSDELKNEYGEEYLNAGVQVLRNKIYRNLDINEVVNTIVEALSSSSPCDRYVVGRDAKYALIWLASFPAFVTDFLINTVFNAPQPRGA